MGLSGRDLKCPLCESRAGVPGIAALEPRNLNLLGEQQLPKAAQCSCLQSNVGTCFSFGMGLLFAERSAGPWVHSWDSVLTGSDQFLTPFPAIKDRSSQ